MSTSPFFVTGANAKIRINGKTMAFCQDLAYSVTVNVQAPKILGMYEAHSMEPTSYDVSGTFTLIRYISGLKDKIGAPQGTSERGNSIGSWGSDSITARAGIGNDGRPHEHMIPKLLATSVHFDIEVYQKVSGTDDLCGVARLRDCRIEKMDFSINKKSPGIERYAFRASYLDEDTFNADFSGNGSHFSGSGL